MRLYEHFDDDIERILVIAERHSCTLTALLVEALWAHHSKGLAGGWLVLPEDDAEIWNIVKTYLEEE